VNRITSTVLLRLALIGIIILAFTAGFAFAAGWLSLDRLSPADIVDSLQINSGVHPGFRRAHAKGLCIEGTFQANGNGAALSKAQVFMPGEVPVIGRFSTGGGQPYAPDGRLVFHAIALSLTQADGEKWRMALDDTPIFVVATPLAFRDLQLATRHVRWSLVPETPFEALDKNALANLPPDFLFEDVVQRLRQGPLRWHMMLTVAQPGDPVDDATKPWPADRPQVDVGTLTINRASAEEKGPCRNITFDPLILPSGISPSDDPLLPARSGVYAVSLTRRDGEPVDPSAASKNPEIRRGAP
jgi:catalase